MRFNIFKDRKIGLPYFIIPLLFMSSIGCHSNPLPLENSGVGPYPACSAVAAISDLVIFYKFTGTAPQFLAVAIDGGPPQADTCSESRSAPPEVSLQSTGAQLKISITFWGASDLYKSYFSADWPAEPIRSNISFELYGRNSCADPLTLVTSQKDLWVQWEPVPVDNGDCSSNAYSGQANAK